jgi:hypothetical protein
MSKTHYAIALEDLCAEIIVEGGQLADELRATDIASSSIGHGQFMRSIAFALLREDETATLASESPLHDLISFLENERESETLDIHSVFDGWHDPDGCAVGTVREERHLTARGSMICGYLDRLHILRQKRRILLARIQAERIINRKLGY